MSDISKYSIEYRILASCWYHECDKSIAQIRSMKLKLRERFEAEPPDTRVIAQWEEKLFSSGSILDKQRPGRPNQRGDTYDDIDESVRGNPSTSLRRRSDELGIPYTTLQRTMTTDLGYKNWKPTKVQYLSQEDYQTRVHCCQQILDKYDNSTRRDKLFFSDECAIYAEGRGVVRLSFWSKENPHFWQQVTEHPPSVMVWAAMSAKHLVGPYFIAGKVTAESYITMLETQFVPDLEARGILMQSHLQQDGAPAHTALSTRKFLEQKFQDRWVSKFGPIPWPPRSPDLTSCDNALWGIIKPKIAAQKAANVDELKNIIKMEFDKISTRTLTAINARTFRRLRLCVQHDGLQVDPYDV